MMVLEKTQISGLVRGHGHIVGSPKSLRAETAAKVFIENPEHMTVKVGSHEYEMTRHSSLSGKSSYYISKSISPEQVKDILPCDERVLNPELAEVVFVIHGDMTCEYSVSRRRTANSIWKPGQRIEVSEREVTIL